MRLTLASLTILAALCAASFVAPNPIIAAAFIAFGETWTASIVANPLRALSFAVFVTGLAMWSHDMLERRGWGATLWACLGAAGLAVFFATLPSHAGGAP